MVIYSPFSSTELWDHPSTVDSCGECSWIILKSPVFRPPRQRFPLGQEESRLLVLHPSSPSFRVMTLPRVSDFLGSLEGDASSVW